MTPAGRFRQQTAPSRRPKTGRAAALDGEPQRPQLFSAVLGDLVRAPWWIPHPVDLQVVHQPGADERGARLIFDDVGQRTGRRRQGHVDQRHRALFTLFDVQTVDQSEIDDIDAELRVDDVAHRLFHIGQQLVVHPAPPLTCPLRDACATASLNAIQPSNAHFTRAGYFETPANAMPSPMTSSSPSIVPRDETISVNAATVLRASPTGWPIP